MVIRKIAAVLVLAVASGAAAANPEMEELLKPCVGCHDMNGLATAAKTPHLNWQLPRYLMFSMLSLQTGVRTTAVPKHIPKTLTRPQLAAIADYYGNNRTLLPRQPTDAAKVAKGEEIYHERCGKCHRDNGRASDEENIGSPLLARQPADFLLAQARLYVSGNRKYLAERDKAHVGLTEADLEAVSHFFASQDVVPPSAAGHKSERNPL